jgi:hypothetical protein
MIGKSFIGRKRRANVGKYVDPPLVPLAPIERVVDEGALIYVASARMALMNHIIVAAAGEHIDYEPDVLREVVREELVRLAVDNEETADRLENSRTAEFESDMDEALAQQKRENQRRRPQIHRLTAETLRAVADSDEQLDSLVTHARADAVHAMLGAIQTRLVTTSPGADADYEQQRAQRIQEFVQLDLLSALSDRPAGPTAQSD